MVAATAHKKIPSKLKSCLMKYTVKGIKGSELQFCSHLRIKLLITHLNVN